MELGNGEICSVIFSLALKERMSPEQRGMILTEERFFCLLEVLEKKEQQKS